MRKSILLGACSLSLLLAGCNAAELEAAKTQLQRCRVDLEKKNEETAVKVGLLKAQQARVCAELEQVVHERTPVRFTAIKEEDIRVPCTEDLYVRVHKTDPRGWSYLAYEKADQGVLYSDRLHYEGPKGNRNTLKFGRTYVSVNSCTQSVCDLECVRVPAKHPTTSCSH